MTRLIGYMSNRGDRLADAIHQERAVLPSDLDEPTGWGLGFFQGGEVLHKKRPLLDGKQLSWPDIVSGVRSDCVLVHLRRATVGDFRKENTHPFRMRSWLFAHNGTIDRFSAVKPKLWETLPDFLQRNVRGETDSELLFHALLSFLYDEGQLDNPDVDDDVVARAIRSCVSQIDRFTDEVSGGRSTLNLILTNGRKMYALRRGRAMHYTTRDRIDDPVTDRESQVPAAGRYVMIVGDAASPPRDFTEVEEDALLIVDRDLRISVH